MKKIMFYSKHRSMLLKGSDIKSSGHLILFFTVFICGILIGCFVYKTDYVSPYLEHTAAYLIKLPALRQLGISVFCAFFTLLIGIGGSMSCFGCGLLFPAPFLRDSFTLCLPCILSFTRRQTGWDILHC